MRIVRHNAYISARKKRARILALAGFLLLSASLFVAWYPKYIVLAYVAMLSGFVIFNMGMQQVGKWTRNPRNDEILDTRMKGLSDRVTLVHYAAVGKHRIEHIAVHPGGVAVLTAREVDGAISRRKGTWRRKGGAFRRLFSFSGPQLGNPDFETEENLKRVQAWLSENQMEVDLQGAVVFVHPKTELDIEDPEFPVLHAEELPEFFRDLPADPTFDPEERERVIELLAAGEGVQTDKAAASGARRPRPVKRVAGPKQKKQQVAR
ncbi:MAG TPA: NERD domain-containing protein [Thermomicrobiales bacterium]|nr:NERD domain-containing protein [Thermomicrobiales bacterium]